MFEILRRLFWGAYFNNYISEFMKIKFSRSGRIVTRLPIIVGAYMSSSRNFLLRYAPDYTPLPHPPPARSLCSLAKIAPPNVLAHYATGAPPPPNALTHGTPLCGSDCNIEFDIYWKNFCSSPASFDITFVVKIFMVDCPSLNLGNSVKNICAKFRPWAIQSSLHAQCKSVALNMLDDTKHS